MPIRELFGRGDVVGIFRGFREGGLEFHADVVLPYRSDFQRIPMHGQYVLVQLENPDEAVLGRITSFSSQGKLSSGSGEEYNIVGACIGLFALGEYVYAHGSRYMDHLEDWVQVRSPNIEIKFPMSSLVSRRSFVFARAGFGKSNLNKLLFSKLYETTPTVTKRGGREVPVGTIIFD